MKNGPYTLVIAPHIYPGKKYRGRYVYEHQLVWWLNTGVLVPKGYLIHHKNGKKRDNRFKNLELISCGTHSRIHKKPRKIKLLICAWCKKPFEREYRNIGYKIRRGQKRFYCCRKHQIKNQKYVMGNSQVGKARNC